MLLGNYHPSFDDDSCLEPARGNDMESARQSRWIDLLLEWSLIVRSMIVSETERRIDVVKRIRAYRGCLGTRRRGAEGCEKLGRAAEQALKPRYPK